MKSIFASAVFGATVLAGSLALGQLNGGPAHVRVYSPQMSCAQVKEAVRANGAVIIYQSDMIYDRYVAHGGYCASGEITVGAYVQSADQASCYAGYVCRRNDNH